MATRKSKRYSVYCKNPECPQKDDSFLVSYEVDTKDDGTIEVIRKGVSYIVAKPDIPGLSQNYGRLEHPCPWCGTRQTFEVPL